MPVIKKIVCASYGAQNSIEALKFIIPIAKKFGFEILNIYVKPTFYYEGFEPLQTDQNDIYKEWVQNTAESVISKLKEETTNKVEIREGLPHEEILKFSREQKADLIVIGRGKATETYPSISRTTLKLIRQSELPVLTVSQMKNEIDIKNILVPTGLYDINSNDFNYALVLSKIFNCRIFHLNVLETAETNLPAELVARYRGDAYSKISKEDMDFENVEPRVIEAKNVWLGISEFVDNNNIQLVVLNTYVGEKGVRKNFIGSVAERVIQTVRCPVLTIRPQ